MNFFIGYCENYSFFLVMPSDNIFWLVLGFFISCYSQNRFTVFMSIELFKEINSLIFHIQKEVTLDKLADILGNILENPKLLAPYKAGLIKESLSYVRSSQGLYRDILGKSKLKKLALSWKRGIRAEMKQAAVTLNIRGSPKRPTVVRSLSFLRLIFACYVNLGKIISSELSLGTDDLIIRKNNSIKFKILLIF